LNQSSTAVQGVSRSRQSQHKGKRQTVEQETQSVFLVFFQKKQRVEQIRKEVATAKGYLEN
jgi:hypothetical protein